MKQQFLFLSENKGIGKTSNKAYHFIEMHNPETLTNGTFAVAEGIDASTFKSRQKVDCELELSSEGFKHNLKIMKITPIGTV